MCSRSSAAWSLPDRNLTAGSDFFNHGRVRNLAVAAIVSASLMGSTAQAATKVHGVALDSVKKVGDSRFKSTEDWEKTVRYFRNAFGGRAGIVWNTIHTPPKIKALHIANTLPKRTWDGINIYETNGDIFI